MNLERELRKSQNTLVISGLGVIAFGFWSVLRAVLSMLAYSDGDDIISEALSEVHIDDPEAARLLLETVYMAGIMAMSAVILFIFFFIGRSCIAVGRKDKKRFLFIPVALVIGFVFLYSAMYDAVNIQAASSSVLDAFSLAIFDFSTGATMLGILYSYVRIMLLKGRIKREAAYEH